MMRRTGKVGFLGLPLSVLLLLMAGQVLAQEAAQPEGTQILYYAITSHQYTFDDGTTYQMGTITELEDEAVCGNLAKLKGQTVGSWTGVAADCVPGYSKDSGGVYYQVMFNEIFLKLPAARLYIAFDDETGYPTRVNFGDAPMSTARQLASTMVDDLHKRGIKDATIIEPDP